MTSMVARGGSWLSGTSLVRAACRGGGHPAVRAERVGFRIVKGERMLRVVRGGSWVSFAYLVRVVALGADRPEIKFDFLGFRIVKEDR